MSEFISSNPCATLGIFLLAWVLVVAIATRIAGRKCTKCSSEDD